MIKNDKTHCVALIDDVLYDATGIVNDVDKFHIETGCDMEFIYKYYDFFKGTFKNALYKEITKNYFNNEKSNVKTLNKVRKYSII